MTVPSWLTASVGLAARSLLAPRLGLGRGRGASAGSQEHRVDIYTFVTDRDEFLQMQESFRRAGFGSQATFTELSDRDDNPFAAVTEITQTAGAPYAILCHQDIRLPEGSTPAELFDRLDQLEERDPGWQVAGCSGVTRDLGIVRQVFDVWGGFSPHVPPVRVMSLDEIVLVLNRRNRPRCSVGVSGFHFYGTDVCLNALEDGGSCYVIGFPVIHLGLGNLKDGYRPGYESVRAQFLAVWSARSRARYVASTIEVLGLSRSRAIARLLNSERAVRWVSTARRRSSTGPVPDHIRAQLPDTA